MHEAGSCCFFLTEASQLHILLHSGCLTALFVLFPACNSLHHSLARRRGRSGATKQLDFSPVKKKIYRKLKPPLPPTLPPSNYDADIASFPPGAAVLVSPSQRGSWQGRQQQDLTQLEAKCASAHLHRCVFAEELQQTGRKNKQQEKMGGTEASAKTSCPSRKISPISKFLRRAETKAWPSARTPLTAQTNSVRVCWEERRKNK